MLLPEKGDRIHVTDIYGVEYDGTVIAVDGTEITFRERRKIREFPDGTTAWNVITCKTTITEESQVHWN